MNISKARRIKFVIYYPERTQKTSRTLENCGRFKRSLALSLTPEISDVETIIQQNLYSKIV